LIMKTNKLILHKENIDVCFENHTNPGTGFEFVNIEANVT